VVGHAERASCARVRSARHRSERPCGTRAYRSGEVGTGHLHERLAAASSGADRYANARGDASCNGGDAEPDDNSQSGRDPEPYTAGECDDNARADNCAFGGPNRFAIPRADRSADTDAYTHINADADADTDSGSDTHTDRFAIGHTCAERIPDAEPHAFTDTDAGPDCCANAHADGCSDAVADVGAYTDTNDCADGDTDAHINTDADTGAHINVNTNTNTNPDTHSDANTNTNGHADSDCDAD
jgi:clumping factor B